MQIRQCLADIGIYNPFKPHMYFDGDYWYGRKYSFWHGMMWLGDGSWLMSDLMNSAKYLADKFTDTADLRWCIEDAEMREKVRKANKKRVKAQVKIKEKSKRVKIYP